MKIIITESFKKKYKNLSIREQNLFKEKLELLLKYGFDYPSLRTHRLKGKLSFIFSLSVNMSLRALFYKNKEGKDLIIEFFSIGNHDIYK